MSHARSHYEQLVEPLDELTCSAVSSWGCCVSSSVESARRIVRSVLCNRDIGTHAVSLQYAFGYVLSGARDGGRPCRTMGTCRVEASPVGLHLHAGHQSFGASLRQPPYFFVLLPPALAGSLRAFSLRPRVLPRGASGTADSADLKNLLLKMRVACDRRRSESRQPQIKFCPGRGTEVGSFQQTILLLNCCCGNKKSCRRSAV